MSSPATSDKMMCPYCRTQILEEEGAPAFCGGCGTPHHKECYEENGGCTLFGCKCAPPDEPKVQVTNTDVGSAQGWPAPPTGYPPTGYPPAYPPAGGYQTSYPQALPPGYLQQMARPANPPAARPAHPTATASPRASSGTAATTQRATASATSAAPTAANAPEPLANSSYVSPGAVLFKPASSTAAKKEPRSRITYILLGLFLGFLGVHNFYAGFAKRGLIQLCLTVCTLFIALFVTWIWAIVEVCTVDRDNNGVIFA